MTTLSRSLNTYLPGLLYELVKYGSIYLSDAEQRDRIRGHLQDYYEYLGKQVYLRPGRKFWRFHAEKLAELGYRLNPVRVATAAVAYAVDLVLNPKATAERAARRLPRILAGLP